MKYQANPVVVDALRIISVSTCPRENELDFMCEGEVGARTADAGMLARYTPVAGDYLVIQSDGYRYLNPKDVFERKYRLLDWTPEIKSDDIVITRDGTIIGSAERVEEFREFCKARGKLLE